MQHDSGNLTIHKFNDHIQIQSGLKINHIPKPDLGLKVFVRKAQSLQDLEKVFEVRWEGYKKYYKDEDENIDIFDFSPHTTLLLAEDEYGQPLGTLRILDRRYGKIELDEFINVDSLLSDDEKSCIEATRFSIPKHQNSKLIKHILWKGVLLYCRINKINTIIKSVRPAAARAYRVLPFEHVGPAGIYNHPLLGNLEHHTYKLNISKQRDLLKEKSPLLYNFFFIKNHLNINVDYFRPYKAEAKFFQHFIYNKFSTIH